MSQVVIDDIIPRTQLTAVGAQTVFNTNWTADDDTDVLVYERAIGVEPDDQTQLVSSSLYNVTFVGGSETVRVTFLIPRVDGDVITIVRDTPAARMNLYQNTNFTPDMLNEDFGILTLVDQQAQMYDTVINPGYNVSATIDPIVDRVLPILAANQTWGMNSTRTKIIAVDIPSGGGIAPADATYWVSTPNPFLTNEIVIDNLATGFIATEVGAGIPFTRVMTGTTDQIAVANGNGLLGNPTFSIAPDAVFPGTEGVGVPQGTTAQRPVTPIGTNFRFNTTMLILEYWDGTNWVQLSETDGVISLTGTANQVLVNGTTGSPVDGVITLTLPQSIGAANSPTFAGITLTNGTKSAVPINPIDIANKAYVDTIATGITVQGACFAATIVNLAGYTYNNGASGVGATLTAGSNGAFSVDGVSPALNARILVKNQSSTFQNGIYTLTTVGTVSTPAVLTRATDYDEPSEINPGDLVIITNGATQTLSSWLESSTVVTIGTDPITFIQFSASLPLGIPFGGTGVTSVTTSPTASAWAGWDVNSNIAANNFMKNLNQITSSSGTTTLTVASAGVQLVTGSSTHTIQMPDVTTLRLGQEWFVMNSSSQPIVIQSSGGNTITAPVSLSAGFIRCIALTGTSAASWSFSTFAVIGPWNSVTPTFNFGTPGDLSITYGARTATSMRIGNKVEFSLSMVFSPTYTTASGGAIVSFGGAAANSSAPLMIGPVALSGGVVVGANAWVNWSLGPGGTAFSLVKTTSSGSFSNLATAAFPSGGTYTIVMSGFYYI